MATNPNMVAIETVTVPSGGAANIEFTSIPQTYTDLVVVASMRKTGAAIHGNVFLKFNSSSSNFSSRWLQGNGASASSVTITSNLIVEGVGNNATASTFGNFQIYIPNYTSANNKSFSVDAVGENNATTAYAELVAGLWSNTAAITSLSLDDGGGADFAEFSSATLYGVTSAAVGAYATGGIISEDNDYWYHTFTSSGTFTPTQNLTADYLVVAGGGGGAQTNGAGGAGGLRSTVTATGGGGSLESPLSLNASTNYTVTVGAGGAGVSSGNGTNGSNSVFSTITSTGGGGGGTYGVPKGTTGSSGGSGGGGGYSDGGSATPSDGGAGTANQGYAGGNGNVSGATGRSGGGGGAGAVGGNANGTNSGSGGNGVAVSISGSSVTYAGGGGGGVEGNVTPGSGGTGGGGTGARRVPSTAATAGETNKGAGGGGGCNLDVGGNPGAAGGSGIVIVRYAK
jgi:hypothetical protein